MSTETDYQKQANDALAAVGATMEISQCPKNDPSPWWNASTLGPWRGSAWSVILRNSGGASYTFKFWQGSGCKDDPTPYDVLACLSWDSSTFENFCDEFGYDTDSRSAHKTWVSVCGQARALKRLFPDPKHWALLQEIR